MKSEFGETNVNLIAGQAFIDCYDEGVLVMRAVLPSLDRAMQLFQAAHHMVPASAFVTIAGRSESGEPVAATHQVSKFDGERFQGNCYEDKSDTWSNYGNEVFLGHLHEWSQRSRISGRVPMVLGSHAYDLSADGELWETEIDSAQIPVLATLRHISESMRPKNRQMCYFPQDLPIIADLCLFRELPQNEVSQGANASEEVDRTWILWVEEEISGRLMRAVQSGQGEETLRGMLDDIRGMASSADANSISIQEAEQSQQSNLSEVKFDTDELTAQAIGSEAFYGTGKFLLAERILSNVYPNGCSKSEAVALFSDCPLASTAAIVGEAVPPQLELAESLAERAVEFARRQNQTGPTGIFEDGETVQLGGIKP
jgi:hypothetical protein